MTNYLQDLETFCIIFSTTLDNEERKNAENNIQKYKKSYSIDAFTYVLDNTNNEMLIYETLAAYGDTVVNNWSEFAIETQANSNACENTTGKNSNEIKSSIQLNQIVMGLLHWVLKNQTRLSHSVWCQAIITLGKMIKKSYSEKINDFLDEYMKKISEYLSFSDLKSKVIALDMINGLLEVFSCINITNQQLKISREAELRLRNEFEKKHLCDIFILFMNLMNTYMGNITPCQESEAFMKSLLTNLETILSWNFLNKVQAMKLQLLPKNEASKRFSPSSKWSNILTDFSIIEFLFKVHDKVRSNCRLGILTMSCLTQLAGLKVKFRHNSLTDSDLESTCYRFSHIDFSFAFIDVLCHYFHTSGTNLHSLTQSHNGTWALGQELYDYEVPLLADMIYQLQEHLNSSVWLDGLMLHVSDKNIPLDSDRNIPRAVGEQYASYVVDKLQQFIHFYVRFCVKCIEGSAAERISKSDTIYIETEERVLSRFVSFTNFHEYLYYADKSSEPADHSVMSTSDWDRLVFVELIRISNHCHKKLFEHFLQAHLAAPDGFRNVTLECDIVIVETDDDDLDLDIDDDDKKKYESGLYAAGFAGLQCINDSLFYLSSLLHARMMHFQNVTFVNETPSFSLLEDLHWLISIIGYTIFNVTDDLITQNRLIYARHVDCSDLRAIYEHSREQLKSMVIMESVKNEAVDRIIRQYQQLLINCCGDIDQNCSNFHYSFDIDLGCCDDIIRLFFLTLRSLAYCITCCESGQLMADFMWLLNRWMLGYVQMLDDCENPELWDVTVLAVFVKQENGKICRQKIVNTCLRMINNCVEKWNQDPVVMKAIVKLMLNITCSLSIARLLLTSDIWMTDMTRKIVHTASPFNNMNDENFSQLITSVMNVASATSNEQELHTYLEILDPIGQRLSKLLSSADMSKISETEIITCMAFIRGMVMTKWPSRLSRNTSEWSMSYRRLFDTLFPWLEKSVDVLCIHYLHCTAIIQLLLESFLELSRTMLLELSKTQTTQFYHLNLNIFRHYSKKSFDSSATSSMSREDTVMEIRYIFTIASELLSRQVFDEFDLDDSNIKEDILGYDVIAQLIFQLAPFISSDILEVPEVGTVFFQCITLVTEFKASTFLLKMNYEFNSSLLGLLRDSILNSNSQISSYSLRSIISLASDYYVWTVDLNPDKESQMTFSLLDDFNAILLKIMNWLRSENVGREMLDIVSSTLIALVKLNQNYFLTILSDWLKSLNNQYVSNKIQVLANSMELVPPEGSSISSFHQSNIDKWNEFVQLVNNYGDL